MLKKYAKAAFVDENKTGEFYAEVNWDPYNEKAKDSKMIRFTFPRAGSIVVTKEQLMAFLFTIGTADEQRDIVPEQLLRSRHYETTVEVEAQKDVKKGEKLVFPLKLTLPTVEEEVIREAKKNVLIRDLTKN